MCAEGLSAVQCIVNPCDTETCAKYPDAECKPNYCGGCGADFYVDGEVVDDCKSVEPQRDGFLTIMYPPCNI